MVIGEDGKSVELGRGAKETCFQGRFKGTVIKAEKYAPAAKHFPAALRAVAGRGNGLEDDRIDQKGQGHPLG